MPQTREHGAASIPRSLFVRICEHWWTLHIQPQSERDRGNIQVPGWRPRRGALLPGLAALAGVALLAPALSGWLVTHTPLHLVVAHYLVWMLCLTAVFVYVAKVTTGRAGSWLRGRHGGYRDFLIVQLAGLAIFLLAVEPLGALVPASDKTLASHALAFVVPLVVGAHFSYTEKLPRALARSIHAESWRQAGLAERVWMLLRIAAVTLGVVALFVVGARGWIGLGCVALGLGLWWLDRQLRPSGFYPYFHHWFAFLCLALLGAGSTPILALASAGFVEGAARWSCAPLWHRMQPGAAATRGAARGAA